MKGFKTKYLFFFGIILMMILLLPNKKVFAEETNTWETKAPMSDLRIDHQTAVINNKVYVLGGSSSVKGYLNSLEAYDTSANIWTTLAPMADKRAGHRVVVFNNKIYAVGGHNNDGDLNSLEVYDPGTNNWITKASMNTARCYPEVVVADNKIYVIGGYEKGSYLNSVEAYDPSTDTWVMKASMSDARANHQAAVLNGRIYVTGGENSSGAINSLEVYDPVTNVWTSGSSMSDARINHKIAVLDEKLYVTGGENGSGYLNSMEAYDPITNIWTLKASMTYKRADHQLTSSSGRIYATGGFNDEDGYIGMLEAYNPVTDSWTAAASMITSREMHQTAVVDNKLYVIGGSDAAWSYLSSVEEFNIAAATNKLTIPAGLTAVGGDKKVNLLWSSVTGSAIRVKRSMSAEGPYTTIADSITGSAFTDTTVTNGITYYYVICGVNSGVESKNSNIAYAVPQAQASAVLTAPAGLTISEGDGKVRLSWTVVEGASSYNIKRAPIAGGPYTTIASSSTNSFVDTGLTNDVIYYYVVTAVNANGESTNSKEVSATPAVLYAALEITFSSGMIKEFYISNDELESFLLWYDNISSGIGKGYFIIHSNASITPYKQISSSVQYKDILYFDAKTYTK